MIDHSLHPLSQEQGLARLPATDGGGFSRSRRERMHASLRRHIDSGELPGFVALVHRPGRDYVVADGKQAFGSDVPMKRPAQPEELAPAYVFLASNADSSYITGCVLQVMGGETAGA